MPPVHECPPTGGSHGKPHWTTKILSNARRRGGGLAARGAGAATDDLGDRISQRHVHWLTAFRRGLFSPVLSGAKMCPIEYRWFSGCSLPAMEVDGWRFITP